MTADFSRLTALSQNPSLLKIQPQIVKEGKDAVVGQFGVEAALRRHVAR
jgi:hypothetical protein